MAPPRASRPEAWPDLRGGAAGLAHPPHGSWRHDGYRMHVGGQGHRLEWVRSHTLVMDQIQHDDGSGLALHGDRVELSRGPGVHERWFTALELPLFVWERGAAGAASWSMPPEARVALSDDGSRLVVEAPGARGEAVFHAMDGRLALSNDGRVRWASDAPARLVVVSATDPADLERTHAFLERRTLSGLARQRAQHAEQLHRGGTAMRAAGMPGLEHATEWARIRADALLGAWLAGSRQEPSGDSATPYLLAEGLLAAGLSHLPRGIRRLAPQDSGAPGAFPGVFDRWTAESDAPRPESPPLFEGGPAVSWEILAVEEIASGRAGGKAVGSFLAGALGSLWGIEPDAANGLVRVAPDVARLGTSAALSRLRVGRSVLDIRLRQLGEVVSIAVRRGAGPPITVDCGVRGAAVSGIEADGQALGGSRARFEAREAHDIQFRLHGGAPLSSPPS